MKKLLVTGSSGMLGSSLVLKAEASYEVYGADKEIPVPSAKRTVKVDLSDKKAVDSMMDSIRPDIVIHCAAIIDVEACEKDYGLAYASNAASTENILSGFSSAGRFIYISTDSVFNGEKGSYNELDAPEPLNNYARSKLEGERFVESYSKNYVIVRTNIFGRKKIKTNSSFAEWVCENLKKNIPIKMFTDIIFSPISVNMLSALLLKLLTVDFSGKLNIGSIDSISKCEFGYAIADMLGLDKSCITPVSVDTFSFTAKRPKNTSLDVSKAKDIFGHLPNVREEISLFCKKAE